MAQLHQMIASGRFTSDGSARFIPLRSDVDFMVVKNFTQQATQQTPGRGVEFEWQRGLADGAAFMVSKEDGADTVTFETVATGGFTLVDQSNQTPEAAVTATAITAANPAVVTATAHGYSVGDRVRAYGTTGMLQIAGMEFTVTAVGSANAFTLGYLDASGFAAAATAGQFRRLPNGPLFQPEELFITDITQATNAVVTLSVTHGLAVDDEVRLVGLEDFGMVQAEGLTATVTAVSTANNTVTLDLDTSGFSAFAFPASADVPFTHAQLVPFGSVSTNVDQALDNEAQLGILLGAGVDGPAGSANDVIYWQAFKSAQVNNV